MKSKTETATKPNMKKAAAASYVPSALEVASTKAQSAPEAFPAPKAPRQSKPIKIAPPAVKSKAKPLTTVNARIDVGFGNALYIRGQGDGLSWDKGTPLECLDGATWVWSTKDAEGTVEFKLLLNDQVWAQGENLTVAPGQSVEITPAFN
ncbi:MAG: hypothetical protein HYY23_17410 [Verrucomicrobia bacterium]|nr:hypothetical protein [Verrucomicrobiota bacterium]